jgi:flagellar biogenesis protein FliO
VTPLFALMAAQTMGLPIWRGVAATLIVLALLAALVFLIGRGRLAFSGRRGAAITIETSCSLGDRRLLVVVAVDGRRLLLGATPQQLSLITELTALSPPAAPAPFATVLDQASGDSARGVS